VRGPVTLAVKVERNNSRNTILPGMMLDLVEEMPPPYFGTVSDWTEGQKKKEKQRQRALVQGSSATYRPAVTEKEAAERLLSTLSAIQTVNSLWWGANSHQFYVPLLRWYAQAVTNAVPGMQVGLSKCLATCYYQMGQYQEWEEEQRHNNLIPARDVEKALRWDGISDGGQGYDVVNDYMSSLNANKADVANKKG